MTRTRDAATKLVAMALAVASIAPIGGCAARTPAGDAASSATAPRKAMPRELVLLQQAMNAMNASRPADARSALNELRALNPEPWVHVFLALTWRLEGNNDRAFEELDLAIDAFEKDPYSAGPLACSLDLELADPESSAWKPLRADPRFAPMLERARKCAWRPDPLAFDDSADSQAPRPLRRAVDDAELTKLREAYALDSVVRDCTSDLERVRAMCRWVHGRTSHDGWNDELPEDALGLLQVAEKGAQWRCVQYGVVVAECLNAVGIPARVVGAQARDVETILAGAGHVFAEAWLEDRQRWVFVDAQLDIVAIDTDGTPLNSAEFRNALARPEPPCSYPRALAFCLHYFNYHGLEGEKSLMLGPVGSAMPTKFQREPTRAPDIFTHRMADAYASPHPLSPPRTVKIARDDGTVREVLLPQTAASWRQLARDDIEASYTILFHSHPGMADPSNPEFPKLLAQARLNALELLPRVDGPCAYQFALRRFNATLQDGHAGPFVRMPAELASSSRWPGFLAAWRGEGLVVFHSEVPEIPVGAHVHACDGKPVETLIRERVFAFESGLDEPGRWWLSGGRVLVDSGNPFLEPLQRCEIQTADGERREVPLRWKPMPDSASERMWKASNGDRLPIGLEWREGRWPWIALPTFQPDAEGVKAYDELVKAIESQRERLLTAPAIVIDLRWNNGGSSYWSVRVAGALWGTERVARRRAASFAKTQTWWRASPENTAYVESLGDRLEKEGLHELVPHVRRIGEGMRAKLAKGEPFFNPDAEEAAEEVLGVEGASEDLASDPSPLTVPVFVIVPPQSASATLDAIDVFKLFGNTRLVGSPSSADSTYMEVRLQELPSGFGQVIVPNKLYVDRPRGNGVYYTPDVLHRELDWSTERFLKLIQTEAGKSD